MSSCTMPDVQAIANVHRALFPAHGSTALYELPTVAKSIGCSAVYIKDESTRFGLPAFKILGASWALCRALSARWSVAVDDIPKLRACAAREPITVYAATDGNHGRALAHVARLLGLSARILVPPTVELWSIHAIQNEGAQVQVVSADYDVAVRTAASQCELARGLLIQDTAWEGYEQIPLDIVHGYTRLFAELDDQLPARSPTHVVVPVGVGSLAHAAVLWYHPLDNVKPASTTIITVEPATAACLQTSLARGESISIITSNTIMPGLNCGTVSSLAWPDLKRSIKPQDAVAVTDDEARQAMVQLKELGVSAGPCGAASLAALRHCNFGPDDVVVLICTEGQQ